MKAALSARQGRHRASYLCMPSPTAARSPHASSTSLTAHILVIENFYLFAFAMLPQNDEIPQRSGKAEQDISPSHRRVSTLEMALGIGGSIAGFYLLVTEMVGNGPHNMRFEQWRTSDTLHNQRGILIHNNDIVIQLTQDHLRAKGGREAC